MISIEQQIKACQDEINEWTRLQSITQHARIVKQIEEKITGLKKQMETLVSAKTASGDEAKTSTISPHTVPRITAPTELFAPITSFTWDQKPSCVKMYITVPNVDELDTQHVNVKLLPESLDVTVMPHAPGSFSQRMSIKKLFKPINVEKSTYRIRRNMITLTLQKVDSCTWEDVKYKEPMKTPKLTKDLDEPNADPGASLMKLMKNLYDEGDDEMKRTIAKAWTESQSKQER